MYLLLSDEVAADLSPGVDPTSAGLIPPIAYIIL